MIQVKITGVSATVKGKEAITKGSVFANVVQFQFDQAWDHLVKVAVFRSGEIFRSVVLDGSYACTIPHEVLKQAGQPLYVGVYGTRSVNENVETVIPTVWTVLAPAVLESAQQEIDEEVAPTPTQYQQMLNLTSHQPKLGENKTWEVWDSVEGRYLDTGVLAEAPQDVVQYTTIQELTEAQKERARENVGAAQTPLLVKLQKTDGESFVADVGAEEIYAARNAGQQVVGFYMNYQLVTGVVSSEYALFFHRVSDKTLSYKVLKDRSVEFTAERELHAETQELTESQMVQVRENIDAEKWH